MSRRSSFTLPALLALAAFAIAPSAFAGSNWSIGIGFPGVSIGYSDWGRHGHGHVYGWGGNYYGGYGGYRAGYYAPIHHRPVYYGSYYAYGPAHYGASYYGPSYYGPMSYGGTYYYSRPGTVVYYDREPVREHRVSRRHSDGYRDAYRDDGYRRASYYDRDAGYRR